MRLLAVLLLTGCATQGTCPVPEEPYQNYERSCQIGRPPMAITVCKEEWVIRSRCPVKRVKE